MAIWRASKARLRSSGPALSRKSPTARHARTNRSASSTADRETTQPLLEGQSLPLQIIQFVGHELLVDPAGRQGLDESPFLLNDLGHAPFGAADLLVIRLRLTAP
jgi:hypothetical protein